MSYKEIRDDLRGVAFTNPTPFDSSGENIRYDKLAENVSSLWDAGAQLIIPCGNTGEYYSLSMDERVKVVEQTVETVDGDGTVVGGLTGSTKDSLHLLSQYEEAGADAAMIMHPTFAYMHEEGLINYYQKLIESTDLGIVLYKRGPELTNNVISQLTSYDNVVGVKYATDDVNAFSEAVEECDDEVVWLNGIAERFALSYAVEGAEGFTTGIGNFIPEPTLALWEALDEGDWERARELRDLLRPYENLRDETGSNNRLETANNVPVVKHGLELAGLYGGPVREPLVSLSEEDKARSREYFERVQQERSLAIRS